MSLRGIPHFVFDPEVSDPKGGMTKQSLTMLLYSIERLLRPDFIGTRNDNVNFLHTFAIIILLMIKEIR
jgi:hypothetical protein